MALRANAILILASYEVLDGRQVRLRFVCADPGPGEVSEYFCQLTVAEITGLTLAQLRTLATSRLTERYRRNGVATIMDPLIGASITV